LTYNGTLNFYLPYFLDWRGRCYSPSVLSHFNGELARNLINLNNNLPLSNEGLKAIKIYAANLQGLKIAENDKLIWFDTNFDKMINLSTTLCKKAKKPITFYNLCLHLKKSYENPETSFNFNLQLDVNASNILHIGCLLKSDFTDLVNLGPFSGETSPNFNIYDIIRKDFLFNTAYEYGILDNIKETHFKK
jgi:hypothetical protein